MVTVCLHKLVDANLAGETLVVVGGEVNRHGIGFVARLISGFGMGRKVGRIRAERFEVECICGYYLYRYVRSDYRSNRLPQWHTYSAK